jgi:hypothetical protein
LTFWALQATTDDAIRPLLEFEKLRRSPRMTQEHSIRVTQRQNRISIAGVKIYHPRQQARVDVWGSAQAEGFLFNA